ncbi:hypothetical protein A1O3_10272 [Capronia epimyces CBS 606.96]|uniref:Protein kinase domain-containing protein n=1 Tax=Capronia epimyces CBS 606.96 TaxID=1182542 RepID=W9Y3R7_9EURO|nr:uncharacterized protein A1O3_10272 [Capronia epimyces CBS 606.96]EXJ77114.1 hypothetical protein A1O3_10272 [Capronia epimyces CBS 606.96]
MSEATVGSGIHDTGLPFNAISLNSDRHLKRTIRPTRAKQLEWAKQMAGTLCRMHDRRVLFVDVASRNMLIHPNGSIVFCDFGTSLIFPPETDIWMAEEFGFSFATDICELGAVIYEVVEGRQLTDFDRIAEEGGGWPSRDRLPTTDDVFLGSVIEACWTKGRFRTTHELCQMLEGGSTADEIRDDQTS